MKSAQRLQNIMLVVLWVLFLSAGQARLVQAFPGAVPLAAPTIQSLIDAAPENGTVNIPAGTYSETLTINKHLTLLGASMNTTILQPASAGQRVITVAAGKNLSLENLKITGGQAPGDSGGGVYLQDGILTVTSCWITTNSANYGGGIFQGGADHELIILDSRLDHNTAVFHGGGVYVEGNISLTNTLVQSNTAGFHGGGIHVNAGGAQVSMSTFSGNQATAGNGGGINVNNALNILGSSFSENVAGDSGGAVVQWNAGMTVTINGADFSENLAKLKGGAVYAGSYLTLVDNSFISNRVDSQSAANAYGGGLYANDGLNGSQLTFTGNQAQCTGCATTVGGGLYVTRAASGPSTVDLSTFDGNIAWSGGGISSDGNVHLFLTNSTIRNHGLNCTPACIGYGGGVSASWIEGDHLLFENNRVVNSGGALAASKAIMTNSRFINNSSTNTTSEDSGGGAVFASLTFSGINLLFDRNAAINGAALYVNGGTASIIQATIAHPVQATGSAVYVKNGAVLSARNNILSGYAKLFIIRGTLTEDYNLFFDFVQDVDFADGTVTSGLHTLISVDPRFMNPSAGSYHLMAGSPAIGAGTNLVSTDLDGLPRINRWDLGAFQWRGVFLPLLRR